MLCHHHTMMHTVRSVKWNTQGKAVWQFLKKWNRISHWKRPWCWERLRAGGEGADRGWDDWMVSPTGWTWVWATLCIGDGQVSLACYSPWGHKELDITERLNWTEPAFFMIQWMLAVWSLVPLPFLNPAFASGRCLFMCCWCYLKILSLTLLACEIF